MTGPVLVQLIDGRYVESSAEEWRHECECRYVADLDDFEAAGYLDTIAVKRSPEAAERLKAGVRAMQMARAA